MAPTEAIGFYGGMALLISSITGPGLTTIPLLFQQAGWFTFVVLSDLLPTHTKQICQLDLLSLSLYLDQLPS